MIQRKSINNNPRSDKKLKKNEKIDILDYTHTQVMEFIVVPRNYILFTLICWMQPF